MPAYDVTVTVWDRFTSHHLVRGFHACGYRVALLGTRWHGPGVGTYRRAWSSLLATQAARRWPALAPQLTPWAEQQFAQNARRWAGLARCYWAWGTYQLAALQRARRRGLPTVLETGSTHARWQHEHIAPEYARHGAALRAGHLRNLERAEAEYPLADLLVVPSRFVADTFIAAGRPQDSIVVNAFGTDAAFWDVPPDARPSPRDGNLIVIYAAQLLLRKGIAHLLDAWRQANLARAELWLCGPVESAVQPLMDRLPAGVLYHGLLSHSQMRDAFRQAHVYVLPSLEEGQARSALEAMAARLPLIVTRETGVTDIMVEGQDGWVVPAGDVPRLADALREADAARAELAARGESARQHVLPYTWEAYGGRAGRILSDLIGGPA
jgi:glycosyltransferase involved in cell wall biosynthesis